MPFVSIPPQVAAGGGSPKPRKLKVARIKIASATWNVAFTTIVEIVLGTMCRMITRPEEPPITRTASTYSLTRSDKVSPRISRAGPTHDSADTTMMSKMTVGRNTLAR